jgi:hypothetical protein
VIRVKGSHVSFEMSDGKRVSLPQKYGILHDAEGTHFRPCDVTFGPYTRERAHVDLSKDALSKEYFGGDYDARKAKIPLPPKDAIWVKDGEVVQIFYRREGRYEGSYYHPFNKSEGLLSLFKSKQKTKPILLMKTKGRRPWYRIDLGPGC